MLEDVVGDRGRISPVAQLMFGFCWTSQSRPKTTWQELSTLVTRKVHVSRGKLGIRNEVLTECKIRPVTEADPSNKVNFKGFFKEVVFTLYLLTKSVLIKDRLQPESRRTKIGSLDNEGKGIFKTNCKRFESKGRVQEKAKISTESNFGEDGHSPDSGTMPSFLFPSCWKFLRTCSQHIL